MVLSIKDAHVDSTARELARLTGESLTEAIGIAIEERLLRVKKLQSRQDKSAYLQRYIDRGRRRAELDPRSSDEILGYDADGLPS